MASCPGFQLVTGSLGFSNHLILESGLSDKGVFYPTQSRQIKKSSHLGKKRKNLERKSHVTEFGSTAIACSEKYPDMAWCGLETSP